jgi:CHAT domain-containing protein
MFQQAETYIRSAVDPALEPRLLSYRALHMANQRRNDRALQLAREASAKRRAIASQYGTGAPPASSEGLETNIDGTVIQRAEAGVVLEGQGATAFGDLVQSTTLESSMLVEEDDLERAKAPLNEATQVLGQEPRLSRRWLVKVNMEKARIAEKEGNYTRAASLLSSAIATQRALFTDSLTEGRALVALGRVRAAQGQYEAALGAFRAGVELVGRHGGRLRLEELLPFFRVGIASAERNPGRKSEVYSEMFLAGQLVRGPLVTETMALMSARLASSQAEIGDLIRELQDARRRRDDARQKLTVVSSDARALAPQVEAVERDWGDLNRKIADLERQVQSAAPRYNQLLDAPSPLEDVRKALKPGEAISQILVGEEGSFGFWVDRGGITAYEIDLSADEVQDYVAELRYPVEATDDVPPFPVARSYELFQRLFHPVTAQLTGTQHIVTVPSGDLLSLPFGVLVTAPPPPVAGFDYSSVPWMASRHALTVAPSVQSFVNLRVSVEPSRGSSPFIGFGDFVPSGDASAVMSALGMPSSCRAEAEMVALAPRLPETTQELRSVAQVVGGRGNLVLGSRFSEATLGKTNLNNHRIVLFATHGLLPSKLQCLPEPALLLSKSAGRGSQGDGLLTSSEVLGLKLNADLVVLSACDTGGPAGGTGGEALSGLARAFFYAGARTLMVTHWEVPSTLSAELVADTFRRAASGSATLAEGLRDAQLAMISQSVSHPKAWAGYTLVGDGGQQLGRPRIAGRSLASSGE